MRATAKVLGAGGDAAGVKAEESWLSVGIGRRDAPTRPGFPGTRSMAVDGPDAFVGDTVGCRRMVAVAQALVHSMVVG